MLTVPARWSSFPVQRQGAQDYACALYCIVSAAIYIGTLKNDGGGVAHIIRNIDAGRSGAVSAALLTSAVTEKVVRQLAAAAGLDLWRPNRRAEGLDDLAWRSETLGSETLWMVALVKVDFPDPAKGTTSPDLHYVLVLEVTMQGVVIADPHPSREAVYVMPKENFLAAWEAARGTNRPKWAGCLGRSRA